MSCDIVLIHLPQKILFKNLSGLRVYMQVFKDLGFLAILFQIDGSTDEKTGLKVGPDK